MSPEYNKATVRRYFQEVLDQRKLDLLDELVTTACVICEKGDKSTLVQNRFQKILRLGVGWCDFRSHTGGVDAPSQLNKPEVKL
jgi:hypothetical protein